MKITGKTVELVPAREADREKIYLWLCRSDLTPSVMGPPLYPDHPIPGYDTFCAEYPSSFFDASGDETGRVFMITRDGEAIGTIGYDLLDKVQDRVVLDLWMRAERDCGHGHGSDALNALCTHIHETYGITRFILSPSARNRRAIAAYRKAGFEIEKALTRDDQEREFGAVEYDDNVLMVKRFPA